MRRFQRAVDDDKLARPSRLAVDCRHCPAAEGLAGRLASRPRGRQVQSNPGQRRQEDRCLPARAPETWFSFLTPPTEARYSTVLSQQEGDRALKMHARAVAHQMSRGQMSISIRDYEVIGSSATNSKSSIRRLRTKASPTRQWRSFMPAGLATREDHRARPKMHLIAARRLGSGEHNELRSADEHHQ